MLSIKLLLKEKHKIKVKMNRRLMIYYIDNCSRSECFSVSTKKHLTREDIEKMDYLQIIVKKDNIMEAYIPKGTVCTLVKEDINADCTIYFNDICAQCYFEDFDIEPELYFEYIEN